MGSRRPWQRISWHDGTMALECRRTVCLGHLISCKRRHLDATVISRVISISPQHRRSKKAFGRFSRSLKDWIITSHQCPSTAVSRPREPSVIHPSGAGLALAGSSGGGSDLHREALSGPLERATPVTRAAEKPSGWPGAVSRPFSAMRRSLPRPTLE
jgi:hypothetical protein